MQVILFRCYSGDWRSKQQISRPGGSAGSIPSSFGIWSVYGSNCGSSRDLDEAERHARIQPIADNEQP
jgi:hypothetical protein